MEHVYFKSGTSDTLKAVVTTSDGKIDYGGLGNTFGLEPRLIRLCGVVFPKDKDLLSRSTWEEIKKLLRVRGTKEDPVLVTGTPRPVAPTDAGGEVLRKLEEIQKQLAQREKQVGGTKVRISAVGLSEMEYIQSVGKVKIEPYEGTPLSYTPRKSWKAFEWDDSKSERGQSAQYLEHLIKYVDVESSQNMFTDVAGRPDFLSYPAFDREFVGTADVAIAVKSAVRSGLTGSGLKCIIQLKKHLGSSGTSDPSYREAASFQTIVAFLMATKKYPAADTVAFLTDLREYWQTFWDDGRTIFYHCFDSSDDAVGYLEHFLDVGHAIRANPRKEFDLDQLSGLDVLWRPKRQKLLTRTEEHPAGDRLTELDGLLTPEEESYFDAQRTILAVRSSPLFWDLPRESLNFEFRGTGSELEMHHTQQQQNDSE